MQNIKKYSINIQELYILKLKDFKEEGEKTMSKIKNVIIIAIIGILIIMMTNIVNATDDDTYVNIIDENANNNSTLNNTNNTNKNNTNNNTNNNTTNSTTNADTLPKAGLTQNVSAIVLVTIFGISAIYAYKKIREYNIK